MFIFFPFLFLGRSVWCLGEGGCGARWPSVWGGFSGLWRVGALCRARFAGGGSIPAGFAAATFPNRDSRLRFGLDLVRELLCGRRRYGRCT